MAIKKGEGPEMAGDSCFISEARTHTTHWQVEGAGHAVHKIGLPTTSILFPSMGEKELRPSAYPSQIFAINLHDHPRGRYFNNGDYFIGECVQRCAKHSLLIFTKALQTDIIRIL